MVRIPGYNVTEFARAGVWVEAGPQFHVSLTPSVAFTEAMATDDEFHLLRVIGFLKFVDPSDPARTDFDFSGLENPVRLQVRVTDEDAARMAKRGRSLALAWWDGRRWVRFQPAADPIVDPDTVGGASQTFIITAIGDPGISWGT